MTDSLGSVRAVEKEAVLFSVGKSKETIIAVEEKAGEIVIGDKKENRLKARFTRLRKSVKKRGLGIL